MSTEAAPSSVLEPQLPADVQSVVSRRSPAKQQQSQSHQHGGRSPNRKEAEPAHQTGSSHEKGHERQPSFPPSWLDELPEGDRDFLIRYGQQKTSFSAWFTVVVWTILVIVVIWRLDRDYNIDLMKFIFPARHD